MLIPVCKPDAAGRPLYPLAHAKGQPLPLLSYHPSLMLGNVLEWHLSRRMPRDQFYRVFTADFAEVLYPHVLQGVGVAWLPRRLVPQRNSRWRCAAIAITGRPRHCSISCGNAWRKVPFRHWWSIPRASFSARNERLPFRQDVLPYWLPDEYFRSLSWP